MVQAETKVTKDLPLEARLAICDVLCLKMCDFSAENCPDAKIL